MPKNRGVYIPLVGDGPAAFKVDFAVEGGVPWTNPDAGRAGTVHLGGDFAEIASTERDVSAGRMPERPFVLIGQQYLADPSRSNGDIHPLYAYAHVPAGYPGDATAAIEEQIERFAPGFRERILARHVRSVSAMEAHNVNYVGGDVVTGANDPRVDPWQLFKMTARLQAATEPGHQVSSPLRSANSPAMRLRPR